MTILLDTNVVSEIRKIEVGKADPNVARWQAKYPTDSFYLSAITLMELELGVVLMERRDRDQGARLRSWMNERVLIEFAGRILPVDRTVAMRCAHLHVPNPRPERDALIAATAFVHGMSIATRNVGDYEGTGLTLVNPWDPTP